VRNRLVRLKGERVVLRPLGQDELDAVMAARDRLQVGAWAGGAWDARGGCCAATSISASRSTAA
jgi:hypothetical protein